MSVDIIVQRAPANKPGEDIVEPLIGDIPAALARGRNELDERSSAPQSVEADTLYRDGVRLGQLALFHDSMTGLEWRGKVTGVTHKYDDTGLSSSLQIKKPSDFY